MELLQSTTEAVGIKKCKVLDGSGTGTMGLIPSVRSVTLFYIVLSLAGRGLATGQSPSKKSYIMRFQVLTAATISTTIFWTIAPCSLIEVDQRFTDDHCLHHHDRDYGGSKNL
jgi:hypothetical protein